jgi:SAM-dependent methyltransferase
MFEVFAREALRLAAPPPGGRLVDVACGPGTVSVLAAQAGHRVDALDFSPGMIEKLRARIAALGLATITPQIGDGQALPYADATFDAGFSMFGLMFFPDRAKGFAELRRVLKPGARAVVSSWPRLQDAPMLAAVMGAVGEAMWRAMGAPAAPQGAGADGPLTTPDVCKAEMSASFTDVEVHTVESTQQAPDADTLWGAFTRTMAPILLMKQKLGDKWPTVDDAGKNAMRTFIGDGPASFSMRGYLTVGTAR